MTRTPHFSHPTPQFPVYCLDWINDETVVLGGGGGASRSGISNKLKLCKISSDGLKVDLVSEITLSNDEDAPMTLALSRSTSQLITGINESSSSIKQGSNANCRMYSYSDNKLVFVRSRQTIQAQSSDADDPPYQKVTAISEKAKLVAVGSTDHKVAILRFPSLEIAFNALSFTDGDLMDVSWGGPEGNWLAITTTSNIHVYRIEQDEKSESATKATLISTILSPKIENSTLAFRSARFSPDSLNPILLAVLRASNVSSKRNARRTAMKAYVCKFGLDAQFLKAEQGEKSKEKDTAKWELLAKREVAGKPITAFDLSENGKLLAYGCSDLSIGVLDAVTLAPLLKILQTHSFPPTDLKFNPSATMLVSASADNTIRTIVVPSSFEGVSAGLVALIIAILVVLLALALRR